MKNEIVGLTSKLNKVIDFSIDNLEVDDLIEIKSKMEQLIAQEAFWIEQENEDRYVYDLKNFLTWLCDYALMKYDEIEEDYL